ncbi:hypothetical protein [Deminuibacter soli]|nr:hypothetical protein [Deminuibacter soli]
MKFLTLFGIILFAACVEKGHTTYTTQSRLSHADSIKVRSEVDSTVKAMEKQTMFDTSGLSQAPVKVLSAKLTEREYSTYKDIYLIYKNVSSKKIAGIKFRWFGETVFGDPADMGSSTLAEGFGGGFTDEPLNPGESDSGKWDILSRNGKKVVLAWPTEIIYEDGSKWKIGER